MLVGLVLVLGLVQMLMLVQLLVRVSVLVLVLLILVLVLVLELAVLLAPKIFRLRCRKMFFFALCTVICFLLLHFSSLLRHP